jgi:hypothetical protein
VVLTGGGTARRVSRGMVACGGAAAVRPGHDGGGAGAVGARLGARTAWFVYDRRPWQRRRTPARGAAMARRRGEAAAVV